VTPSTGEMSALTNVMVPHYKGPIQPKLKSKTIPLPPQLNFQQAYTAVPNQAQAKPPQGPRRLPPFGPRPGGPRPQQLRRVDQESSNVIADATALLGTMSVTDRHAFLVDQAKGLGL